MKGILLIMLATLSFSATCRRSATGIAPGVPECIRAEISNNQLNENWMTGTVEEYEFQNNLVYAFQPDETRIKDGATTIKDKDCNTLCHIGGFGGPAVNQCQGENFFQKAILKRIVWKKKQESLKD